MLLIFFIKYARVISLRDKKGATITNALQKCLDKCKRKPYKIWLDKGSNFYNRSVTSCLQDNNIEMYSTHNKKKSVVAERFIRSLKTKIYKQMTSISKNVYIGKLDDIVNKCKIEYHSTIKMKLASVKDILYIDFGK